jgi:hypothetical protein
MAGVYQGAKQGKTPQSPQSSRPPPIRHAPAAIAPIAPNMSSNPAFSGISMIRKSGHRFSEKIMLEEEPERIALWRLPPDNDKRAIPR